MKRKGKLFNPELAATCLVESDYCSMTSVAKKWGVSRDSISNWRKRLPNDPQLSAFYELKKREFETEWHIVLANTLTGIALFSRRVAASDGTISTPEMVHALSGSAKILGDILLTREYLRERERYNLPDPGDGLEDPKAGQLAAPTIQPSDADEYSHTEDALDAVHRPADAGLPIEGG